MKKTNDKIVQNLLKHSPKDKVIFIKVDGKWCTGFACQSKTKTGVRFNRFIRLLRRIDLGY